MRRVTTRRAQSSPGGVTHATGGAEHAATCRKLLASMYGTYRPDQMNNASLEHWQAQACPWEETRHSGYFSGYDDPERAHEYASHHACSGADDLVKQGRLSGHRIYLVGDSLMRQLSQSLMCRMRRWLHVVDDGMKWANVQNKWGKCSSFSGPRSLRHCMMKDGCVAFEGDVRICYLDILDPLPRWVSMKVFWRMVADRVSANGIGAHTTIIGSQGHHIMTTSKKDWDLAAQRFAMAFASSFNFPAVAATPSSLHARASNITLVYKELEATHFPTTSGLYNGAANRSGWFCKPINESDPLPPLRALELEVGIPTLKRLGWRVLTTYDSDARNGAVLHSTQAKVPSRKVPVDCVHWMLPGVPDIWVAKLLRMIAHVDRVYTAVHKA